MNLENWGGERSEKNKHIANITCFCILVHRSDNRMQPYDTDTVPVFLSDSDDTMSIPN